MNIDETIVTKMADRVKKTMPDLLTDEELATIVKKCIKDTFFKERVTDDGTMYKRKVVKPSIMIEIVEKALVAEVTKQVTAYFENNPKAVIDCVKQAVEDGILATCLSAVQRHFTMPLYKMGEEFGERLDNLNNPNMM